MRSKSSGKRSGFTPLERKFLTGFTLAELIVAVGLGTAALIAIISLFITYQRSFVIGSAYMDITSSARIAMDWMEKDIKSAARILASWGSYSTTDNQIVLEVPSIDASGDVIDIEATFDHIIYLLQGTNFYRVVSVDASSARDSGTRLIAENCSSLAFSSNGIGLGSVADVEALTAVSIALTSSKNVTGLSGSGTKTLRETLNSTVELRNKR